MSQLLSKWGISSSFDLAQRFLESFSWSNANVSWNPLLIRTYFYDFLGYGQRQSNLGVNWLNSQRLKRLFSPSRLLQQRMMITIENGTVAGDRLLWSRGNFFDSSGSIGNARNLFWLFLFFFVKRASELGAIRAGSKMRWVELCNFHFCGVAIFVSQWKNSNILVRPELLVEDILERVTLETRMFALWKKHFLLRWCCGKRTNRNVVYRGLFTLIDNE